MNCSTVSRINYYSDVVWNIINKMSVEINDFGYPQNSEIDTLKSYITTESIMSTSIAPVCHTIFPFGTWQAFTSSLGGIFQNYCASYRIDKLASR